MTNQLAEFFKGGLRRTAPGWFVGLCRIGFGLLWLYGASWKLPPLFDPAAPSRLGRWLQLAAQSAPLAGYRSFVTEVVIPHQAFFGWLLFLLELVVGLMLALGFLTRLSALLGLLMSLNLLCALAGSSAEARLAYAMMAAFHGLFIATNAGLNWGVDHILREKLANSALRRTARGRLLLKIL